MLYVKKLKNNNNCKATATSWKDSNFKFLEPYSLYSNPSPERFWAEGPKS